MRKFKTGATRNLDADKFDYEAFLSPLVVEAFGAYMHKHRVQADGKPRSGDNWQHGIPLDSYMKSMLRHVVELWKAHRGLPSAPIEDSLGGIMFNTQGYWLESLKGASHETHGGRPAAHKGAHRGQQSQPRPKKRRK